MQEDIEMQYFIARQNIEHFSNLLKKERDPSKRRQLKMMLAEEMAKLVSGRLRYGTDEMDEPSRAAATRRGA